MEKDTCTKCGSTVKDYMRGSCAMWGQWDRWHDTSNPHYVLPETWRDTAAATLTPAFVNMDDFEGYRK